MNTRIVMALLVSLFMASAFANTLPTFQELDADGNGALSESELEVLKQFSGEDSQFADTDFDNSGGIDSVEYQMWVDLETAAAKSEAETSGNTKNN